VIGMHHPTQHFSTKMEFFELFTWDGLGMWSSQSQPPTAGMAGTCYNIGLLVEMGSNFLSQADLELWSFQCSWDYRCELPVTIKNTYFFLCV
jgi:hypothetical protein